MALNFYVYSYNREDGTPYYIGKGKGNRAYVPHTRSNGTNLTPTDPKNISILQEGLSDQEAMALEKKLIAEYGRIDTGTGILRNLTDGGQGASGVIVSEETRDKMSKSRAGKKLSAEHCSAISEGLKGKVPMHAIKSAAAIRKGMTLPIDWVNKVANSNRGKKRSEESKSNISNSKRGLAYKKVECPHCGKIGGSNTMPRYHFDNCKNKVA